MQHDEDNSLQYDEDNFLQYDEDNFLQHDEDNFLQHDEDNYLSIAESKQMKSQNDSAVVIISFGQFTIGASKQSPFITSWMRNLAKTYVKIINKKFVEENLLDQIIVI